MIKTEILLLILIFTIIYFSWKINCLEKKHTEHFAETLTTEAQITRAVKNIYLADVEAIRLLSNFAIQLSQGGYTVPGNMTISGNTTVNGNTTFGGNTTLNNGVVVKGNPNTKNESWGNVHIIGNSDEGPSLTLTNTKKRSADTIAPQWTIYNMADSYGNKLSFWRYGTGTNSNIGSLLDLYDDGRVVINGKLIVNELEVSGTTVLRGAAKLMGGAEINTSTTLTGPTNIWSDVMIHDGKTLTVSGNLKANGNATLNSSGCAGYYVNIVNGSRITYSIVCSIPRIESTQSDDFWVVNPGYKVVLYKESSYLPLNTAIVIDNTDGIKQICTTGTNTAVSFRVYFNGVEITYANLS